MSDERLNRARLEEAIAWADDLNDPEAVDGLVTLNHAVTGEELHDLAREHAACNAPHCLQTARESGSPPIIAIAAALSAGMTAGMIAMLKALQDLGEVD